MRNSVLVLIAACLCSITLSSHATVLVGDKLWLQPADLLGYSWRTFDAACPAGACDGQLGGTGPDVTGWTWASIDEVGDLFATIGPHPGGIARFFSPDVSIAGDILSGSGFNATTDFDIAINFGVTAIVGYASTAGPLAETGYLGFVQFGLFPLSRGSTLDTTSTIGIDDPTDVIGGWLYRAQAVPAPATVWLMLLPVAGVVARRILADARSTGSRNS